MDAMWKLPFNRIKRQLTSMTTDSILGVGINGYIALIIHWGVFMSFENNCWDASSKSKSAMYSNQ